MIRGKENNINIRKQCNLFSTIVNGAGVGEGREDATKSSIWNQKLKTFRLAIIYQTQTYFFPKIIKSRSE